jgi:hypothetical protein
MSSAGSARGADSRYFGARSDRDCGLMSALQGVAIAMRWPLMISFAVMGLVLVDKFFPQQEAVAQATAAIHRAQPELTAAHWHDFTAAVANNPAHAPAGLVAELEKILGPEWRTKLPLVGVHGNVNPEQILPAVRPNSVPTGLRGFILVAMLAAMISALTGSVNQTAALMVCDIYRNRLRPQASNRELLAASCGSLVLQLVAGFWMGGERPQHQRSLGLDRDEPHGGHARATGAAAVLVALQFMGRGRRHGARWRGGAGAARGRAGDDRVAAVSADDGAGVWRHDCLLTAPTPVGTLRKFHRTTRPFGAWGPLRDELPAETRAAWGREHRNDIFPLPFIMVAQVALFLLTMQAVIHAWSGFAVTLAIFLVALAGVYWFWWRSLPPADNPGTGRAT